MMVGKACDRLIQNTKRAESSAWEQMSYILAVQLTSVCACLNYDVLILRDLCLSLALILFRCRFSVLLEGHGLCRRISNTLLDLISLYYPMVTRVFQIRSDLYLSTDYDSLNPYMPMFIS